MSDDLRDRFDAFRADSMAHARPPGVQAVQRRVARRRSVRAVALIVAALVVAVLSWLPGGHVSRSPAPVAPSPSPSLSPPTSQSASLSPSPPAPTPSRPRDQPSCPHAERYLSRIAPDTYVIPTELINACPSVRLRLVRVTYIGLGAGPAKLTRYESVALTLSPSVRSVTFQPVDRPSGTCYAYETAVLVSPNGGTPAAVPAMTRTDESVRTWFTRHGYPVVDVEWGDPRC